MDVYKEYHTSVGSFNQKDFTGWLIDLTSTYDKLSDWDGRDYTAIMRYANDVWRMVRNDNKV